MTQQTALPKLLAVAAALLLLGGLGAYWPQFVGADDSAQRAPSATVADTFTYQGYLTDENDEPLNGTLNMRFQIFNAPSGGTELWDSGTLSVLVNGGLFAVDIPATSPTYSSPSEQLETSYDLLNGEALWLAQRVGGELLTPRQEILAAPIAHTLRPGAVIKATSSQFPNNYAIEAHLNNDTNSFSRGAITGQTTTGNAVFGVSAGGRAIYGQTESGHAIYGFDGGTTSQQGYGGYFYSTNGIGAYGYSGADRTDQNNFAPGIYGVSNRGVGVYGRGDISNSSSFYNEGGRFEGGTGVYGFGSDSDGHGGDFRGSAGLRARGTAASRYGGEFYSNQYRGLFAEGNANFYDGYFGDGLGISASNVLDRSGRSQSLVINLGTTTIEAGDLVAMVGIGSNPETGEPMLGVAKLDGENRKGVIGVAQGAISAEPITRTDGSSAIDFAPSDGVIHPNTHLAIITAGLAPAVNVSSLSRSVELEIGDKLTLSALGIAGRIASDEDDIVIGKVAGPVDAATGTVPLFIDVD